MDWNGVDPVKFFTEQAKTKAMATLAAAVGILNFILLLTIASK